MSKSRLILASALVLVLSACGATAAIPPPPGSGDGGRLEVVATAYPLFEASGSVGGSRTHVTNIVPNGALADATLNADQVKRLREADVAVILGGNTQPRIEAVAKQRTKPTLRVLDIIKPDPAVPGEGVVGSVDPYVWLDPANVGRIATAIEQVYVSIDAQGAAKYEEKRAAYDKAIAGVDRMFAKRLSACNTRTFLTTIPTFQYMADRYGLKQVGVANNDRAVADAVKQNQAKSVFFAKLPGLNDARRLRSTTGARVSTLDPLANQSDQARRGGASYGMVMKLNLDALTEGLGCIGPRQNV